MKNALAPSTKILYMKHYTIFCQFVSDYFPDDETITEEVWILFVSYLHRHKNWSPATIVPALSAVSFILKLSGRGSEDYSKGFIVRTLVRALQNTNQAQDTRQPITLSILERLVIVPRRNHHDIILFPAMYSLMFFALLRIGEVCTTSGRSARDANVIQRDQVEISPGGESLTVKLIQFKHSRGGPVRIVLTRQGNKPFCPVVNMYRYLQYRGTVRGPLFLTADGRSISRQMFVVSFQRDLLANGYSYDNLKPHSFRIGGACYAAESGYTDAQIRRLGRWHSNAFMKYLRAFGVGR